MLLGSGTSIVPVPYPLDSSMLLSFVPEQCKPKVLRDDTSEPTTDSSNANNDYSSAERSIVRAMVNEQDKYLSSKESVLPMLNRRTSPTMDDEATNLSIEYSFPFFITVSLISQYGYTQTKRICSLMNNPGPITIRRNAIQFNGSDEDLCKWLQEEDGIHAEPLSRLLGADKNGNFEQCTVPMMNPPSDGTNNYVMTNLASPGAVMPPEGAIQIIPTKANTTSEVENRRNSKSIWSMKGWQLGYFEVQDAGSQLIVQSLEVSPGDSVLDYCAGNGGKCLALASAIMNAAAATRPESHSGSGAPAFHSQLVAHDVVEERLRQIKGSSSRVGFVEQEEVYTTQSNHDNASCTIQLTTSSDLGTTHNASSFDAVLVDAPCSSTGVLRRRPSQRWDISEEDIKHTLPTLQLEILTQAASFVSTNCGKLIYSTCSLLAEENEEVVRKFEQSSMFLDGGFERWNFVPSRSIKDDNVAHQGIHMSHSLTLLPSENGSDGFFIARWKRKQCMQE